MTLSDVIGNLPVVHLGNLFQRQALGIDEGAQPLAPVQGPGALTGTGESFATPLHQTIRDDDPLDFAGTLPDAVNPEFPVESLGHVFAHVAAPTEDLHGTISRPVGELRAEELGHGALAVENLDVVFAIHRLRHVIGHESPRPQFGQTVCQGNWTAWFSQIGRPNWTRFLAKSSASSMRRLAAPQQRAAIFIRS